MPIILKRAALCLNWSLAIALGCLWYTQRAKPPQAPAPDQSQSHDHVTTAKTTQEKQKEMQARSNGLDLPALKDPAYHEKLNRWLKLTRTRYEIPLLQILNLPDDKRSTLIALLVNHSLEGIDTQELTSDDPVTQRQMRFQGLADYLSKIADLLGDKFQLYNQFVGLTDFRRETIDPVGNVLEMYGTLLSRDQQADLVNWFSSDHKRQKSPYESLANWADDNRSNLTAQQKQTLGPILKEFAALNPPKTKKSAQPATP